MNSASELRKKWEKMKAERERDRAASVAEQLANLAAAVERICIECGSYVEPDCRCIDCGTMNHDAER